MCALINNVAPVTLVQHPMDDMSCCKVFGADYRIFSHQIYFFLSFCTDKRSKSSAPGAIIRCRSRCGNSKLLVLAWCANFVTQGYGLCLRALRNSLVEKRHSITVYK